jgi:alpha-1,3-rhamnosyl/mannosyltransferase
VVTLAVDCREFVAGRVTGIGRFLRGLMDEIARNRPHLTTVAIVGPTAPVPVAAPHIHIHRLPQRPTLYLDQILLPRALRQVGATLFFSPYYKAPLAAPCPTVVTIHDLIPLQFPAYTRGVWRLYATAFRPWAGLLARRAAAVITDSEQSRLDLISVLGLPPERVHAIPIGIGEEFRPGLLPKAVASATARYGIGGPYILSVGNFLPHKNLPRLVEAYSTLPQAQRDRIRLVLAGTPGGHGPARPVDQATLLRPGVLLPGFIAPEDLPLLYAGATALVCPSLAEGFGLPVLEAMACGTPVVCARAGALPEVAGDAALYVDPTDVGSIAAGLGTILEDEPLRRELASRGLARARLFEARKTTARLVDLLEGIAARGREG